MMQGNGKWSVSGHGRELWPVLFLLFLSVALPAGFVLWLMSEAMENQRLATRQKLRSAYASQLRAIRNQLEQDWKRRLQDLDRAEAEGSPAEAFQSLVLNDLADSAVFLDVEGHALYPSPPQPVEPAFNGWTDERLQAERLEFVERNPAAAAALYGRIGEGASSIHGAAAVRLAQARCLAKADQTGKAIRILSEELGKSRYRTARSSQGRFLQPDSLLRALELMAKESHPAFLQTASSLEALLRAYGGESMPSSQRRYLMKRLRELRPDTPPFPTLEAEDSGRPVPGDPPPRSLVGVPLPLPHSADLVLGKGR